MTSFGGSGVQGSEFKKRRIGWEAGRLENAKAPRLSGLPAFKL
jgi:hypothetical protein